MVCNRCGRPNTEYISFAVRICDKDTVVCTIVNFIFERFKKLVSYIEGVQ